jgi:hypothetical protein
MDLVKSLCRYYEIGEVDLFARGIWLLALVRDMEVREKKIGVLTLNDQGLVTEVAPINVV